MTGHCTLRCQSGLQENRDTTKVEPLLEVLEDEPLSVVYYALDLCREDLHKSTCRLRIKYPSLQCFGLWGDFSDGLKWCSQLRSPKLFLSLGSTFANGRWDNAVARLCKWVDLMTEDDLMLFGLDGHGSSSVTKVWKSYHDSDNLFRHFVWNGMCCTNALLGDEYFHQGDWKLEASMDTDKVPIRHRFEFVAQRDVSMPDIGLYFPKSTKITCYESTKYSEAMMRKLCDAGGLELLQMWKAENSEVRKSTPI